MGDLLGAVSLLDGFRAGSLKRAVAKIEASLTGGNASTAQSALSALNVNTTLLLAALLVKKSSSQINEIVHAVGILVALHGILEKDEVIESMSLAAGNTGKGFDLETSRRIAEFTFIQSQGGSEVVRQNKIFKDFYFLAETKTTKRRELYVIGTELPEKFFRSRRSLSSILGSNSKLGAAFRKKYGTRYKTVADYYVPRGRLVDIRDLSKCVPVLSVDDGDAV